MVDHDTEVSLQHFVDRPLEHLVGKLGLFRDQAAGQNVPRENNRFPVGCSNAFDHQHVRPRLELEPSGLAVGRRLHRVARLLYAGLHTGGPDRVSHAEVCVQAVGDAAAVGDERARTPHPADQALAFEGSQRFAERGAGNAQLRGERRLRRKP